MSDPGVTWLAARVAQLRDQQAISQAELASRSGLELADVEAIEAGSFSAPLRMLRALAMGFKLQLSELFEGLELDGKVESGG